MKNEHGFEQTHLGNHIVEAKNKTRFFNEKTAKFVIKTILEKDEFTYAFKGKYGRTVLSRKFNYSFGVDTKNKELFIGKVVLGKDGAVITSYPTRRI